MHASALQSVALAVQRPTALSFRYPLRLWFEFCRLYKIPVIPSKKSVYNDLLDYAQFRFEFRNGTANTVPRDIDAIQHFFALNGFNTDAKSYLPLKKFFNFLKIAAPGVSRKKRALRVQEFQDIFNLIPANCIDGQVLRTALAIAASGALRIHEFTAPSNSPNVPDHRKMCYLRNDRVFIDQWQELVDDNIVSHRFGVIFFPKSKTSKSFVQHYASLPCMCPEPLCACCEIVKLRDLMVNIRPETVLLTWANGTYVAGNQIRNVLKNACLSLGGDPSKIGTHSMRKYSIVRSMEQGLPDTILALLGRWTNFQSIRSYTDMEPLPLVQARVRPRRSSQSSNDCNRFRLLSDKPSHLR